MKTKPITLRVPEELKKWIETKASRNQRSVTGEIVYRLIREMEEDNQAKNKGQK